MSRAHELIARCDAALEKETDTAKRLALKQETNQALADMLKEATADTLDKVLYELSNLMKNSYSRSDA